jgi:signal transduction histidine kinase
MPQPEPGQMQDPEGGIAGPGPEAETDGERDLRQIQKMRMLGALAGGIAHDFNNILTSILGATELIGFTLTTDHPANPMLEIIRQAAHRARELNRQILTFSRKAPEQPSVFDLAGLIQEATGLMRIALPKNVTLHTASAAQVWIKGDPNQIHQVFMNLAVNGVNAMFADGGELSISVDWIQQDVASLDLPPGRYAVLRVGDTGCGMTPAVLENIFTPFFTTKTGQGGTGLGLAIARRIVHNHGGVIRVHSEPGVGSQFQVLFPASKESDRDASGH